MVSRYSLWLGSVGSHGLSVVRPFAGGNVTSRTVQDPVIGMLVRPIHKLGGYRTILDVQWKVTEDTERQCQITFLLHKNPLAGGAMTMKTPWYPIDIFWNYWTCSES